MEHIIMISLIALTFICVLAVSFLIYLIIKQFDRQRTEWNAERMRLLDRIQAGSLMEYKQIERADKPKVKKESDPFSKEPWA